MAQSRILRFRYRRSSNNGGRSDEVNDGWQLFLRAEGMYGTMTGVIIGGLIAGCLFALTAVGLVLIYRTSRAFNFAQGDIGSVGAFLTLSIVGGAFGHVSLMLGVIAGLVASAVTGMAIYILLIRPLERSGADLLSSMIVTLGVSIIIEGLLPRIVGYSAQSLRLFPSTAGIDILGTTVSAAGLVIVASTFLILGLFALGLYRTRMGLMLRMGGSEETLTLLSGVNVVRLRVGVWALGGLIAGWALMLFSAYLYISPTEVAGFFLAAAIAASWGAFQSIPRTLVGAIVLGIVVDLASRLIPFAVTEIVSFLLLVGVFLVIQRRQGKTFIRHVDERVNVAAVRPQYVEALKVRRGEVVVIGIVFTAAWYLWQGFGESLIIQVVIDVIALSGLAISMRYCGRPNLGGAGFLAIGAYGSVVLDRYVGLVGGFVGGVVLAAALGMVLAVITANLETIFYAQISLLMSAALPELIMALGGLTGGAQGLAVIPYLPSITLFGRPFITLCVCLVGVVVLVSFTRFGCSRAGAMTLLCATDTRVARTMGINVTRRLVMTDAMAAGAMGLAGVLVAHTSSYLSPDQFGVTPAVLLLAGVVIGGGWTKSGIVVGAVLLVLIPQFLGGLNGWPSLIFGVMLVSITIVAPTGIEGLGLKARHALTPRRVGIEQLTVHGQ